MREQIRYLHTNEGTLEAVQIPVGLWRRIEPLLKRLSLPEENTNADMAGFQEFMDAWNFSYSYRPEVRCPNCGTHCADWRNDPGHRFRLASADISGHLVFHCNSCGATVRQKYFKDHMAEEFTRPPSSGQGASV